MQRLAALVSATFVVTAASCQTAKFSAMGDMPYCYSAEGSPKVCAPLDLPYRRTQAMLKAMEQARVPFGVHVGDVMAAAPEGCREQAFVAASHLLRPGKVPLYFIPGDNETTDCPSPTEALQSFRRYFLDDSNALAQAAWPENHVWEHAGVVLVRANTTDPPYSGSEEAAVTLLKKAVAMAGDRQAPLVLFTHAKVSKSSYSRLNEVLLEGARRLHRPVLLVHGNTHTFTIQKNYQGVPNLTRHEVAGAPAVGWSSVTYSDKAREFEIVYHDAPQPTGEED